MTKKNVLNMDYPLACKLASIVGHLAEFYSPDGREIDIIAAQVTLNDPLVKAWLLDMQKRGLAPQPRLR